MGQGQMHIMLLLVFYWAAVRASGGGFCWGVVECRVGVCLACGELVVAVEGWSYRPMEQQ